jgi:hypothetical protein
MNTTAQRILFWTPRILCILFAIFISLFALDVFDQDAGLGETILALLIHLIPTYVVLIVLALAWRRAWIGAIAFIGLAAFYVVATRAREHWAAYLGISGPLVLTGVLFLADWLFRDRGQAH